MALAAGRDLGIGGDSAYRRHFDGYDYSSGESLVAFGDAANVSYGFNTTAVLQQDPQQITGIQSVQANAGSNDVSSDPIMHNATPEVTTNDFGTTFTDNGTANGDSAVAPAPVAGVPLARYDFMPTPQTQTVGQSDESTQTLPKWSVPSAPDIGSTFGAILNPVVSSAAGLSSTAPQMTVAQPRNFFGQLAAGGAVGDSQTIIGIDTNTLIMCGAALLVLGILLHLE